MSTNFHTPITTGAPANASVINTPFGALDAAIQVVDERVDSIIASSGTSSTEVVDARDSYTVLQDRIRSAYLSGNVLLVDPAYPVASAGAKRFKTIAAAMAAAVAGDTIMLAPGGYNETVTFATHGVKLVGSGAAGYNVGSNDFSTGTLIVGRIDLNNKAHCSVHDLSIDGRAAANDGIGSGGSYALSNTFLHADIRNVVIVGNGSGSGAHGIRMEAGSGNNINNVRIYACSHGIALRCSMSNVNNAYIEGCGSSAIIVKSATVNGDAFGINISNVVINTSAGIVVEANDASTNVIGVSVVNCYAHGCITSSYIVREVSGDVTNVAFTNCHSFFTTDNGFDIQNGLNIILTNCHSNGSDNGFKNTSASGAMLIGCTSISAGVANISGSFQRLLVNGATSLAGATLTSTGNIAPIVDENGLVINMPASNTTDGITVKYAGTDAIRLVARANNNTVLIGHISNGASNGPNINVGYNFDGSTPSAGHVIMYQRDGNFSSIWPDASGVLRIVDGAQPVFSTDTGGTVVGAQTSMAAAKHISDDLSPIDEVIDRIRAGAEAVKRFTYRSGAFGGQEFEGVVTDLAPEYGMDRDADHPQGKALNEIGIAGDLLRFATWAMARIDALEAKLDT